MHSAWRQAVRRSVLQPAARVTPTRTASTPLPRLHGTTSLPAAHHLFGLQQRFYSAAARTRYAALRSALRGKWQPATPALLLLGSKTQGRHKSSSVANTTAATTTTATPSAKPTAPESAGDSQQAGHARGPPPKTSSWGMIRRMAVEIWPRGEGALRLRAQVCLAVTCVFATKLIGIGVPYWFKGVVDTLSPDPSVVLQAFNPFGFGILGLVVAHSVFRAMQSLTQEARGALFAPIVHRAMRSLGVQVAEHLHNLPLAYHVNRQTGSLSRSIDRGTKAVDRLLNFALFHIIPTALELVLVSAVLYMQAGLPFALTALGAVGAYSVFTFKLSTWRIGIRKEMNKIDSQASSCIVDGLLNYETVKYHQNEAHEVSRYNALLSQYEKKAVITQQSLGFLNFGQQFMFTFAMGVSMAMSVARVSSGTMTLGDLVLVNALLMQLSIPLHFLGTVYRELQSAVADMEALFDLLDRHTNKQIDCANAGHPETMKEFTYRGGTIEFKDVHFRYKEDQPMLRGVSFAVPAGTSLGVVGPSGCGKSTIMKLLFKFYAPDSGTVSVDGQDVQQVKSDTLRRHMGVIPQDTVLFNDTLMYNVRYGNLDASEAEALEASRKAGLHDAVSGFSDGYDTRVGERGLKLSGGEKQRVAIARALLRRAPILLADEATSALDTRTEARAVAALRECSAPNPLTSVIIAHRLSTVNHCDAILVLKDGHQSEYGTHDELLANGGLYSALWEQQLRDSSEAGPEAEKSASEEGAEVAK